MAKLDHIMFATTNLDHGIAEIEALTGVTAAIGGAHPGMGTRNALLSLGEDQYLEIIVPDPEQEHEGNLAGQLITHGRSGIRGWAVATNDILKTKEICRARGLEPQPIVDMNRTTPDGIRLDWQVCLLNHGRELPFFIDWKDSLHPAQTTPKGCFLENFTLSVPDAENYQSIMEALGVDVTVSPGSPGLTAELRTPRGLVEIGNW
jgi:hypothetical protein